MAPPTIRQLGYISFEVPDLAASIHDAVEIRGLRLVKQAGGTAYLTANRRAFEVSFTAGKEGRALCVGVEAFDEGAVKETLARVKSAKLEILDDRSMHEGIPSAFRFVDPWGHVFEVHTPVPRDQKPFLGPGVTPKRLDHVGLGGKDTQGLRDMLIELFGMRLSDSIDGNGAMWMRTSDGWHHTISIAGGPERLHHYSFEIEHFSDYARLGDCLHTAGRKLVWGVGRHGAGQNYFSYYKDAVGCLVETTMGMERIEDDATFTPRVWKVTTPDFTDEWINMWGVAPTRAFIEAGIPFSPA
jgi:catechol 2,3-dioxygenase